MVGLVAGTLVGIGGQALDISATGALSDIVAPLGALWINALQMTVIPLVVTQLLAAIVSPDVGSALGKLGGKALLLFVALLLGAGLVTVSVTEWFLAAYTFSPDLVEALRDVTIPEVARTVADAGTPLIGDWLTNLVPRNPFEAAASGSLLQILVFTALFGAAIARLPEDRRMPLVGLFRSSSDAMMVLVSWVMMVLGKSISVLLW